MLSMPLLFGLGSVVLATSFLSGIFGMAGGMILMGVLLLLVPVPIAMMLHGIAQAAANGWRAILWWRYVQLRIVAHYAIGAVVALGAVVAVRFVPDRAMVLITLGLMPFAAAVLPDRLAPRADRPLGAATCGFVSMGLHLVAGLSGPAIDVFFVRTGLDRRAIVATKAACQVLSHLTKLAYFAGVAVSGPSVIGPGVAAAAIGLAVLGTTLSRTVLDRLTDHQFRSWTQRIVLALGAVYLAQGVWEWAAA